VRLALEQKWNKVSEFVWEETPATSAAGLKVRELQWVIIHDGACPLTQDLPSAARRRRRRQGCGGGCTGGDTIAGKGRPDGDRNAASLQPLGGANAKSSVLHNRRIHLKLREDATTMPPGGADSYKVKLYMGSYDNIKITTPRD
jgi:hypothetical protein